MKAFLSFAALTWLSSLSLAAEADLILHHGKIVTVDKAFSIREAMALAGNRILAVGANDEVLKLKGPRTVTRHLSGRMVLPGLMDSHAHPIAAAMTEFDHPIPQMETIQDVLDYIRSRTQALPEGDWIVVQQVFITRLREQRYPSRMELDRVAPRHPVMFRTGPDASLNSLALKRSGIDRDFKVTDGGSGFVEKDSKSGEPTGLLRNCTRFVKVQPSGRRPTDADRAQRLVQLFRDYNAAGLTSVGDRDASVADLELYRKLRAAGQLTVRVSASQHIDTLGPMEEIQARIRRVAEDPLFKERDDFFRIIGIKTYLDGGMLTGSAYLREPWGVSDIYAITDPAYRGVLFIPHERLLPIVRTAVESGLQFTAHSVGDGAVHALLDVYEEIARTTPVRPTRPCISHANFMSRDAVDKLPRLGVSVDIQPAWLYLDTRTLRKHFGDGRLRWFQPLRSIFETGGVAGGGSDHMQKIGSLRSVNPYSPFLGMATAITRRAKWQDGPLHPEEALTRQQAIRFYTMNNAWLLFCDDRLGSLEPGKMADFIVLDTDLLTCAVEAIARTQVDETYLDGKPVFSRP
ncbi:MAG: amidohydrolase [Verrucomicrobia bacterium]|nr:amidohydrolase [Verrucomicrobiota bacterium]